MSPLDFKVWLKHHISAFTAVGGWLSRFPTAARNETDVTQGEVRGAWEKILAHTSLEDAIAATDALAAGTEAFSEKAGYDHHPRDVRRIAMQARGERHRETNAGRLRLIVEGQETFACALCQDQGVISIIHPASVNAARKMIEVDGVLIPSLGHHEKNPHGRGHLYTCAAACRCKSGDRWRQSTMNFDEAKHLAADPTLPSAEQWEAVIRFAEAAGQELPF